MAPAWPISGRVPVMTTRSKAGEYASDPVLVTKIRIADTVNFGSGYAGLG